MEGTFKQFGSVANNYKPVAQFLQLFIGQKIQINQRYVIQKGLKNYESRIALADISTSDLN